MVISDFGKGLGTLLRPQNITKNFMYVGQSIKYYYRLSVIPALIFIFVGLLFGTSIPAFGISSSTIFNYGFGGLLGLTIAILITLWILTPIRIIIFSSLTHLFGKHIFGLFRNSYDNTFAAEVYGITPALMFSWAPLLGVAGFSLVYASTAIYTAPHTSLAVPIIYSMVGLFLLFITDIWSIGITLIALANQQGVSKLKALFAVTVAGFTGIMILLGVSYAYSIFWHAHFFNVFNLLYQFL